jgi:ribosomal protein S12 methylthiotransferase accessory factor
MVKQILKWHPAWVAFGLKNSDVIVLSAQEQRLFNSQKMPLLTQIDGIVDVDEIAADQPPVTAAMFYYFSRRLQQQNLLVDADFTLPTKGLRSTPSAEAVYTDDSLSVVNLSYVQQEWALKWANLIRLTVTTHSGTSVLCLLVDDFIDDQIVQYCAKVQFDRVLLLQISSKQLQLSPLFNRSQMPLLIQLQRQMLENQPLRRLLLRECPAFDGRLPVVEALDTALFDQSVILEQLSEQWTQTDKLVLIIDLDSNITTHPVNPYLDLQHDFAEQIQRPVVLQSAIAAYASDGGSRCVSPQTTVARLMPLISEKTGVLHQFKILNKSAVTTYHAAFNKYPVVNPDQPLAPERFVQGNLGKGLDAEQSQASALGEAVERYAAQYSDDTPLIFCPPEQLEGRVEQYRELAAYSQNQYRQFADNQSSANNGEPVKVKPYNNEAIHWLPVWSMSEKAHIYLPLSVCFAEVPFADADFGRWHSNGCAAGNTLEEAVLQGLLELIERDASAIWWYNKIERPRIDLAILDVLILDKLQQTLGATHDYWVLDISHDIGIPVMAAVAQDKHSGGFSLGFGCHLDARLAAQRALTEVCQMQVVRHQHMAPFDFDAIVDEPFLRPNADVTGAQIVLNVNGDISNDIENIVARLAELGLELLVLDHSRAHLPLKTVKTWIPGLAHIWPELANERLYQVPTALGWLAQANTETELNHQALYI